MKALAGALIGTVCGATVAVLVAVAAGPGSTPWFAVAVPAGLILGWRAGAAWGGTTKAPRPSEGKGRGASFGRHRL